jgi:putative ABC transport system permease protein
MALGASRASVQRMFLWQALRAVGVGSIIGVLVAIPLARLARGLLFGIEPVDPLTYAGVLGLVGFMAAVAAWAPAVRASRVSPGLAMVAD